MELKKVSSHEGIFYWNCEIDQAYKLYEYRRSLRMGGILFGVTTLLFYLLMLASRESIPLPIYAAFYAFTFLLVLLTARIILRSSKPRRMCFRMTDRDIEIGSGRSTVCVSFRNVVRAEPDTDRHHVVLATRFSQPVICIPAEDFDQIRDYIVSRVDAESRKR